MSGLGRAVRGVGLILPAACALGLLTSLVASEQLDTARVPRLARALAAHPRKAFSSKTRQPLIERNPVAFGRASRRSCS